MTIDYTALQHVVDASALYPNPPDGEPPNGCPHCRCEFHTTFNPQVVGELLTRLEAVKALHAAIPTKATGRLICPSCTTLVRTYARGDSRALVDAPCPTIRALEGEGT